MLNYGGSKLPHPAPGADEGGAPDPERMNGKRILIVDDHAELRKLVRLTLGPEYEIREAVNGRDALDACRAFAPDLVLLDVMMPGELDGYQVCAAIRADPTLAATRVVLLTARGQRADRAQGIGIGADEYVVKPFSPLALIDLVERMTPAAGH